MDQLVWGLQQAPPSETFSKSLVTACAQEGRQIDFLALLQVFIAEALSTLLTTIHLIFGEPSLTLFIAIFSLFFVRIKYAK